MRYAVAIVLLTAILNAATESTAHAQDRRGFWIGSGIGLGSVDVSTSDGINLPSRARKGAFDILTGWTLTPQLLIGMELNITSIGVIRDGVFQDAGIVDLDGAITYYPRRSSGFFVKGGVGGSFFDDLEESPAVDVSGTGVGAIVGTGYDIYLGRNLSLTTAVDFRFSRIGSVTLDGQSGFRGWKHNVIDFTLGIKFNCSPRPADSDSCSQ